MMSSSAASSGGTTAGNPDDVKPAEEALLGPLTILRLRTELAGAVAHARWGKALLAAVRAGRDRRERRHTDHDYAYEEDDDDSSEDIPKGFTAEELDGDIALDLENAEEACHHETLLQARMNAAMKMSYKLRRTTRAAPRIPAFMGFWVRLVEPYLVGEAMPPPARRRRTLMSRCHWSQWRDDESERDDDDRCSVDHFYGPGSE